ncbi:MAG: TolC family protein [Phycisphaerae bacterium]|nr:TolC family protein [Gemmatimonadaceae bacterium]
MKTNTRARSPFVARGHVWHTAALIATLCAIQTMAVGQVEAQGALTLGEAARMAAQQHTSLDVVRSRVAQADARVQQQRAALYPDVSALLQQASRTTNTATFGFSFRDATGNFLFDPNGERLGPIPTTDARYRVSQTLLDFGAYARVKAAKSVSSALAVELNSAAEAAAASAALAYIQVIRADAQLAARVADSLLAADLERIAREQLQAGVGIALDVTRAQSQSASVRIQLISTRGDRDRARLQLRRALNLSADAPLVLADSLSGLPFDAATPDAVAVLSQALANRADLRLLKAQEDAQRSQAAAIRSERWPILAAVGDHGALGRDWAHPIGTYTWGVQLSLHPFDGFRRGARLQEQSAVSRELDARERDVRMQATLEVESALLDITATREQIAAVSDRLRFAEQEVSQAQERFRAGVAGNSDVIIALLSLNQTRTLRNDALAAYHASRVALARSTGALQQLP